MAGILLEIVISFAISLIMSLLFKQTNPSQSPTYSAQLQTAIDNSLPIPLLYGTVKVAGNMLWSEISTDQTWLYKLVSFSDGPIQGITDVRLNDIPINGDAAALLVWNSIFSDARVQVTGNTINLYANGQTHSLNGAASYDQLGSEIITLGGGWTADIPGNTFDQGTLDDVAWTPCCNSPVSLLLSGTSQATTSWCNYYLGNPGQGVDSIVPGGLMTVGPLNYDAYVALGAQATNQLNGDYNVTAVVQGRLVRVYSDVNHYTVQWSNNPAWCIFDFLTCYNGVGLDYSQLDIQSFINAAAYCDQTVRNPDGSYQKRFTLNFVLDERKSRLDWLVDMMRTCSAYPTYQSGVYGIMVEQPGSVTQVFDEDSMNDLQIWWSPLEEIPDIVHVVYVEPAYEYAKVAAQARMATYIRDYPFTKEVDIYGITNWSQASRLAWFYLNQATTTTTWCKFKTDRRALTRTIGDIVSLNDYICNFQGKQFRIMQMSESEDDAIEVTCREYNPALYTDSFGSVKPTGNLTTLPNPLNAPPFPNITSITQQYYVASDKSIVSNLTVGISSASSMFFRDYKIWYSTDNGNTWNYSGSTPDSSYTLHGVTKGLTYLIKIIAENAAGVPSIPYISAGIYINGQVIPPVTPANFTAVETVGGIKLNWNYNTEPDIACYELFLTSSDPNNYIASITSNSYFYPTSTTGNFLFLLRARDNSNNTSPMAAYSLSTSLPSQVQGFYAFQNGMSVTFSWEQNIGENVSYEIRAGNTWDSGMVIAQVMGTSTTVYFAPSGAQNFWIKAKDMYGYYCSGATWATINVAPAINRNNVLTLDPANTGWIGPKYNCAVVGGGLQLNQHCIYGEYNMGVVLPASMTARNWVDFTYQLTTYTGLEWSDCNFTWNDLQANAQWLPVGNDDQNTGVSTKIAYYTGVTSDVVEDFSFEDTAAGVKGTNPTTATNVTYGNGRYYDGVLIKDTTNLLYNSVTVPAQFSLSFTATITSGFSGDTCFLSLKGANNTWMRLNYSNGVFTLLGSDGNNLSVSTAYSPNDSITFGISQTGNTRRLLVYPLSLAQLSESDGAYAPIGVFTSVALYANI